MTTTDPRELDRDLFGRLAQHIVWNGEFTAPCAHGREVTWNINIPDCTCEENDHGRQ